MVVTDVSMIPRNTFTIDALICVLFRIKVWHQFIVWIGNTYLEWIPDITSMILWNVSPIESYNDIGTIVMIETFELTIVWIVSSWIYSQFATWQLEFYRFTTIA